jgi:hypothetical protein
MANMNRLLLAEIERVYAVQEKKRSLLIIVAQGFTSGSGGSLHIIRSRTKIYPPLFEIYALPGITSQLPSARVPTMTASTFPGTYEEIQVAYANNQIIPKIIEAIEEESDNSFAGDPKGKDTRVPGELIAAIGEWIAIHDFQHPGLPKLWVEGSVLLPNLGVAPKLIRAVPQVIYPKTLFLNLVMEPVAYARWDEEAKPIIVKVRYEEATKYPFKSVEIEPFHKTINVLRSRSLLNTDKE